jgi:hypothetical protein
MKVRREMEVVHLFPERVRLMTFVPCVGIDGDDCGGRGTSAYL